MAFINDSLVFPNLASVTGMVSSKLVDGMFYACSDLGNGLPGWYLYSSGSVATLKSPEVIDCTNGPGRFLLFGLSTLTQNTFTKAQGTASVELTDGANIPVDCSLSNSFFVTLAGDRTLDNPTNMVDGFTYVFKFIQDGTGTRLLSFDTAYKFSGGTAPTLSTDPGVYDYMTCVSDGTNLNCTFTPNFN